MDMNEWNVLSQMLRQAGNAKKETDFGSSVDQQYQNVPIKLDGQGSAVDVLGQYAMQLSGDNVADMQLSSLSYTTTDVDALFSRKSNARLGSSQTTNNSLNGATRSSAESNIVKSLLTCQQYIQPNENHQLNASSLTSVNSELNKSTAVLQSSVNFGSQPLSYQPNETNISGLAGKMDESIASMISGDLLPENVASGEKVYVLVDGITYEIVTGSSHELMAQPTTDANLHLTTGMSLEDLANVSAQHESLRSTDAVSKLHVPETEANMIHQAQLGLELLQGVALQDGSQSISGQHCFQLQQQQQQLQAETAVATTDQEGMQIIIMPSDGDTGTAGTNSLNSRASNVVKHSLQDYMLQTGQSLPAELQELVARGIDLSNCKFLIQDEDEAQHNAGVYLSSGEGNLFHSSISADLQQQLASVMSTSHLFTNQLNSQTGYGDTLQPVAVMDAGSAACGLGDNLSNVSSSNVLALLASTAVANQEQQQTVSLESTNFPNHVPPMPMIAPEGEDDGEFSHLVMDQQVSDDMKLSLRPNPCDTFLKAFLGFIQGHKPETLSSVANSTITKRHPLPMYDPDLCRRPVRNIQVRDAYSLVGSQTKSPVNVSLVYTSPSGSSLVNVGADGLENTNSGQISVTPFIIQRTDDKSVVFPSSELQQYHSRQIPKQDKSWQPLTLSSSNKELLGRRTNEPFCRIITRKLRGSDDDSFDESDQELGAISCISDSDSDPAWKPASEDTWLKKHGQQSMDEGKLTKGKSRVTERPGSMGFVSQRPSTEAGSAAFGYFHQPGTDSNSRLISSSTVNSIDAHNYQKGDFIVERKDMYNHDGFPLWKIEGGRLLQKYEPFKSEIGILHKSASIYSSWSGDIRSSYKAVLVDMINTLNQRSETVRVLSEYVPLPLDDSLEQDALMELFNIYIQDILSQALDPLFLSTVMEQQEEYYLGPLRQIDGLLTEAQQTLVAQISWTDKFKTALEQCPCFQLMSTSPRVTENLRCQATIDSSCPVVKSVKFFGTVYNSDLLQVTGEVKKATAETFYIGQIAADHMPIYHALHHYKFLLFKKCEEEVRYLRLRKDKTDEVVLGECLQNRIFVQQCLRELKQLLEKCSIVITVVTKAEQREGQEQMAVQ